MSAPDYGVAALGLDPLHLSEGLRAATDAGASEFVLDVVDGTFASGFGLSLAAVEAACKEASLPCHVQLRIESPDRYLDSTYATGCSGITVPIEACVHAHRTLSRIRDLGLTSGVAVNPTTPLTSLEYVLPLADRVHLLAREWGSTAGETPRAAYERVRILRENLDYAKHTGKIVVSGHLDARSAGALIAAGADVVVIERADVVRSDDPADSIRKYMQAAAVAAHTA